MIEGVFLPMGPGFSLKIRSPINSGWNVAVVLEQYRQGQLDRLFFVLDVKVHRLGSV